MQTTIVFHKHKHKINSCKDNLFSLTFDRQSIVKMLSSKLSL